MISVVIPVYRDAANGLELAEALLHQRLPDNCPLEIIIVDDGSGDSTPDLLKQHENKIFRVIALIHNTGRAAARNAGAESAQGEYLVFIDCDCRPIGDDFLVTHLRRMNSGCIASCGRVTGIGSGFWTRYQEAASLRRERQHARGVVYSGSTQNFAVRRQAFMQLGGFDARYREYGFEDRDLLIRLSRLGDIGWSTDAVVRHLDELTLPDVLAKMQQSGGSSAALFSCDHPTAYRALGYAAIDSRLHRWLRPFEVVFGQLLSCAKVVELMLDRPWMPYPVAKAIVKVLGALAFVRGSADADR